MKLLSELKLEKEKKVKEEEETVNRIGKSNDSQDARNQYTCRFHQKYQKRSQKCDGPQCSMFSKYYFDTCNQFGIWHNAREETFRIQRRNNYNQASGYTTNYQSQPFSTYQSQQKPTQYNQMQQYPQKLPTPLQQLQLPSTEPDYKKIVMDIAMNNLINQPSNNNNNKLNNIVNKEEPYFY